MTVALRTLKNNLGQIIFVATISPFMLAAFIEWALFIAAFIYCLAKVYQKADHWSIKTLAIAMMIIFSILRYVFLSMPVYRHADIYKEASSSPS
jgi:chitin synthase